MYAIDIDRLNVLGAYAAGILSDRLEDYLIFGETVLSPTDGRGLEVEGGVLDHPPLEFDSKSGAGNYVVIERADGLQVALLHLMHDSVLVKAGDEVAEGDPIGRVGNSGFSTQPHLHLEVSRAKNGDSASAASRIGVPIHVQGRFLIRNSLFREGD